MFLEDDLAMIFIDFVFHMTLLSCINNCYWSNSSCSVFRSTGISLLLDLPQKFMSKAAVMLYRYVIRRPCTVDQWNH